MQTRTHTWVHNHTHTTAGTYRRVLGTWRLLQLSLHLHKCRLMLCLQRPELLSVLLLQLKAMGLPPMDVVHPLLQLLLQGLNVGTQLSRVALCIHVPIHNGCGSLGARRL